VVTSRTSGRGFPSAAFFPVFKNQLLSMIYLIDLFCGAGGVTTGIEMAHLNGEKVAKVISCVNHDYNAIESHKTNHPDAVHYVEDIRILDLTELRKQVLQIRATDSDSVIAIWASLECTNFSKAKGGLPRDADSRTLAEHLYRYIDAVSPQYVFIENVEEFMSWGPLDENGKPISRDKGSDYVQWCNHIQNMGYSYDYKIINSADLGAYTSRKRFFAVFYSHGMPIAWPEATHAKNPKKEGFFGKLEQWKPVREVLNLNDHGKSIFGRKKPLSEKTLSRIYAGLIKYVAGGKDAFLLKYNSINKETGKHIPPSIDEPCPVVAAQSRLGVVKVDFLSKYYSGDPDSKNIPISGPAGALTCIDSHAKVTVQYLTNYHGKHQDDKSLDSTAGTVTTKDDCNLITAQFIDKSYSGKDNHQSVHQPAGCIMTKDKYSLVTPYIMDTQFSNVGSSVNNPFPTIVANRKHHYLVNPQWNTNSGSCINAPCPTLIARQDKAPLYMITTEFGCSVAVYQNDSELTRKIKEFMAIYGIADILMRMLHVDELLRIQGFPEGYKLIGTQADQKKFIGNSVVPLVPKKWIEAIAGKLNNHHSKVHVA
jgi:DNA (cytosine-5)-methyltransferase 1